jgi:hypothetical protein
VVVAGDFTANRPVKTSRRPGQHAEPDPNHDATAGLSRFYSLRNALAASSESRFAHTAIGDQVSRDRATLRQSKRRK